MLNYKDLIAEDLETHGAFFCPIILGSDKTTVSVATGHNEYWPVYLSIRNLHNNIQQAHRKQFPFDSNPIQNKSPARQTLYLVVSVMQSFEPLVGYLKQNTKQYLNNSFTLVQCQLYSTYSWENFFPLRPYAD